MKRPVLVTVVAVLQSLLALAQAGTVIYLVWLSHSPQILSQADAADSAHGLMIGAAGNCGPAVALTIASWGLWTSKRWGGWASVVINLAVFGVLIYATLDDNSIDWEQVGIAVCFGAMVILLLLPKVRKFYRQAREMRSVFPVGTSAI